MSGLALRSILGPYFRVESDGTYFTTVEKPDLAPFVQKRRPYLATCSDALLPYVLNISETALQRLKPPALLCARRQERPS